ncbi:MAG: Verru_Chthon cassette protein A, partial [Verrucomicrobiota bacterium]
GMIRTYDSAGKPGRSFKLYSSATMVTAPGSEWIASANLATEVPSDWATKPALFTDLNAPLLVSDPKNGGITLKGSSEKMTASYPILDPSGLSPTGGTAATQDGVEGFDLKNVPGFGGTQSGGRPTLSKDYDPTLVTKPGVTANPAPMPVQWIYVLRDGRLTSPTGIGRGGLEANWANLTTYDQNKPSAENPIIGRIAFWTDDETSKLNINVNSEGTYWDRAWAVGPETPPPVSPINGDNNFYENELDARVPVKNEYQRYPGHPAMTCLSPVFGYLTPYQVPNGNTITAANYAGAFSNYYAMVPRISVGGTKGGTVATASATANPSAIAVDRERLYASVDELAFNGDATAPDPAYFKRPTEGRLTAADIQRAKFFLTTNARCAEVTAFNTPRLLLWQLQQQKEPNAGKGGAPTTPRNPKDQLLAFCGTANGFPYYFQRYSIYLREQVNNRMTHRDVPFKQLPLYGYEPPSSQSPLLDWQKIPRNQDLYKYLQRLTENDIPGLGGKLTTKYPAAARDQILTEMVDLIRMGTNAYATDMDPAYEYAPAREMPDAVSGESQIVSLVPPSGTPGAGTKGFGRFPTITEASLIFYDASKVASTTPDKMRVVLVLQPFTPTSQSWYVSPLVRYVVKGLEKFTINNIPSAFRNIPRSNLITSRCGYGSGGAGNRAYVGIFAAFRYWGGNWDPLRFPAAVPVIENDGTKRIPPSGTTTFREEFDYPFVSDEIPIDPNENDGNFEFSGGDVTVEIHAGYATAPTPDTLVQTVNLRFPPGTWPLPRSPSAPADKDFNNRIGPAKFNLVNVADTVRSLQVDPNGPTGGDLRIVAAQKVVPADFYAGHVGTDPIIDPGYDSTEVEAAIVHSLRNGDKAKVFGGKINANLFDGRDGTPAGSRGIPIAARGTTAAVLTNGKPGDWDNGPNEHEDGCYVNNPNDFGGSTTDQSLTWATVIITPNRQVHSPVVFGSLPVGSAMNPVQPWRTLLFCANPAAGADHPGFANKSTNEPADHAFLDFFTMPIVEPYAISEPCSTAGKINLNYQLAPFTYIRRATALHGVLKSMRITAIPSPLGLPKIYPTSLRKPVDVSETLKAFDERFDDPTKGGMFRAASEICDMQLVPKGTTLAAVRNGWWKDYALTGDNAREVPYGQIYSRVTTKSNSFTVHMRVQALKKRKSSSPADQAVWNEDSDTIASEYRGSAAIERYVDTGDTTLPDFATNADATLDRFYKFRIIGVRRFSPSGVVSPMPTPTPEPTPVPPPTPTPTPGDPTPVPTPVPTLVPTPTPGGVGPGGGGTPTSGGGGPGGGGTP